MSVTRIDEFRALPGKGDAVLALLRAAAPGIEAVRGCRRWRVLRSDDDATRFLVVGEWDDVGAHRDALGSIPPEPLADAMALLAEPPVGTYWHAGDAP